MIGMTRRSSMKLSKSSHASSSSVASGACMCATPLIGSADYLNCAGPAQGGSGLWRHVARSDIGAAAEEVAFHLLGEVLPRLRIGQAQTVLVDEHRLLFQPLLP